MRHITVHYTGTKEAEGFGISEDGYDNFVRAMDAMEPTFTFVDLSWSPTMPETCPKVTIRLATVRSLVVQA